MEITTQRRIAKKSTAIQADYNLTRIAELSLQGQSSTQIAESLYLEHCTDEVLTPRAINQHLVTIRTLWRDRAISTMGEQFSEANAALRHIERQHWLILEKGDKTLTADEKARHLNGALKAVERRIKLLGLDKPDLSARLTIDYSKLRIEQKQALASGAPLMEVFNMGDMDEG